MTDAAYVFNQDVRERSRIKNGALAKKNGSKSKKCTLPSDNLPLKEKRNLNGKCESLKLNEPFHDWREFRKYSVTMQVAYLENLINNYGARQKDIADMFSITTQTVYVHCKEIGVKFSKKGFGLRDMDNQFLDFLTKPASVKEPEPDIPSNPDDRLEKMKKFTIDQAKTDAIYIRTFYEELVQLGFNHDEALIMTNERAKLRFLS